ncbi:MAG: arylsulfatase [Herminiimonas sp.]|nr:arylsulfatase [Herminiimonas sp.]MDB5853795.1 arylsulfatase [Herminiimonas sp.]
MTRIALIHALAHSVDPINEELKRTWPECQRMNLLDDSLSADLAASGKGLDAAMTERFIRLADYAVGTGADAILFTCSAFGPCIEAVARRHADRPVMKPNEAMIADAVATGQTIGLVASFGPTLESMPPEFPASTKVLPMLVEGALDALNRGDTETHDRLVVAAAQRLVDQGCTVIALAQFSLARTQEAVARQTGAKVLTTVESAVRALRARLSQST